MSKQKHPREYSSWANMKTRCLNEKNANYPYYGGRGISIDPAWMEFKSFLADMGPRPVGYTLERRDNNGHYTRENCYWATRAAQSGNRRTRTDRRFEAVLGQQFGRLTAVEFRRQAYKGLTRHVVYCRCSCGQTCTAWVRNLLLGHTRSCGCLRRDLLVIRNRQHLRSPTTSGSS